MDRDPEVTMALLVSKSRSAVHHVIFGCSDRSSPGRMCILSACPLSLRKRCARIRSDGICLLEWKGWQLCIDTLF